jgi:VWFA-related protein
MPVRPYAFAQFTAFLLLALLPGSTLSAQSTEPVFKVKTRIVILDIVVTDKKGNVVTNLKQSDFTVLEDKQPQTIQSFEPPSAHDLAPAPEGKPVVTSAADLPKIGNAPVTIIVLDELNTAFSDMSYGRRSLAKYLQTQPAVLKQPTTLISLSNTRFQLLHDYTQDRDDLIKVLQAHFPEYPFQAFDPQSGQAIGNPNSAFDRIAQTMHAWMQVVKSSSGTPGRKNIIWVGANPPKVKLSNQHGSDLSGWNQLTRNMSQSMLENRVTMYDIDPTIELGLQKSPAADDYYEDSFVPKDPLTSYINWDHFATVTGGKIFAFRNDVNNEIATAIDNSVAYYTLSYSPTNKDENESQYRLIKIVLSNPDLIAKTREGYYPLPVNATNVVNTPDLSDAQRKRLLLFDFIETAISPLPFNGLAVTAQKGSDNNWQVTTGGKGLTWTPQPNGDLQAEVSVVAVALDAKNKLLAHTSHEKVSDRKTGTPAPDSIVFQMPAEAPAGTTRIRFIVRDAVTGKIGTADVTP